MKSLLFRRKYKFWIPTKPYSTSLIIDTVERIRENRKKTTMRSWKVGLGATRIQLDYQPTYILDFYISINQIKKIKFGYLNEIQVINDLGLTSEEINQIKKHTTIEEFFYTGYITNFPKSKIQYGDTVYLVHFKTHKLLKSQKLTKWIGG